MERAFDAPSPNEEVGRQQRRLDDSVDRHIHPRAHLMGHGDRVSTGHVVWSKLVDGSDSQKPHRADNLIL